MAYIGKQPLVGNYTVLDSLTATTTDTYALTKGAVAVYPHSPANCIVSLNGVIQAPFDSYTISGSNIVFASALTASDSIDFITVLGDVLNVGTVSDDTITTAKIQDGAISLAKLSATGTKDATTFLRGDNTFAEAGGGGKVLQVITATDNNERSTTSTSFVTVGTLNLNITPATSGSKILLMVSSGRLFADGPSATYSLFRDATNLGDATYGFQHCNDSQFRQIISTHIDNPATTSQITYTVKFRTTNGSFTAWFNTGTSPTRGGATSASPAYGSFTAIEIGA